MTRGSARTAEVNGAWAATLCYLLWGLFPIFWKQLASVDATELIAHRHLWTLVFLIPVIFFRQRFGEIMAALGSVRSIALNLINATLLTVNWLIFVWGMNHGHVIECSLGYFLVPLLNVVIGRVLLREHLRPVQWAAILLAAIGVGWQLVQLGRLPWLALGLAVTWGAYGFLRKKSHLGSLVGLTTETALLTPIMILFLWWRDHAGLGAFGRADPAIHALIICSGVVTAVPLLLFAYAARRILFSTLGLLQYIAPTVQLAIGLWIYHEPFSRDRAASFAFIWAALAIYSADNFLAQRRKAPLSPA